MSEQFDLIVIGSGAAGGTAAVICSNEGFKVAVIDSNPFGGTCALRGCVPKKVLVGEAETVDAHNRMMNVGVTGDTAKIDWPAAIAFKNTFTQPTPALTEKSYADAGITNINGRARFISKKQVQVGDSVYEAKYFLLANGAKPLDLGMPGKELVTTSEEFLNLKEFPGEVIFIGGGFISFEFAHVANRTGAKVTILDRGPRPLKPFDPDLVEQMVKSSLENGINIRRSRRVEAVEKSGDKLSVRVKNAEDEEETYEAGLIVHGAGRVPDIDDLELEAAGIERSRRGVVVNDYLQSVSNPMVYAAGDTAEIGPPLTPVALYHAKVVAQNMVNDNIMKADHTVVPSIVFTVPPLAGVGLLEIQARESGIDYRVNHQDTSQWYSSKRLQVSFSSFKVIIDKSNDTIVGAHVFGPGAEELINVFAAAMRSGITATELGKTIFAYPTFCSDIAYMV